MLLQVLKKLYQNGIVVVSIIANKKIQIVRGESSLMGAKK